MTINEKTISLFNMMGTEPVTLEEVKTHVDKAIKYHTDDLYCLTMMEEYGAITYRFTNGSLMRFADIYFAPGEGRYKFNQCSNDWSIAINNSVLGTGVATGYKTIKCTNRKAFYQAISIPFSPWLKKATNACLNNNKRALVK